MAGSVQSAAANHDLYFPSAELAGKDGLQEFDNEVFTLVFRAMNEPILYSDKPDPGISVFRLVIKRSFQQPLLVKASKQGGGYQLLAKRFGQELSPGLPLEQQQTTMSAADSRTFDNLVRKTNLFDWQTYENPAPLGADGDTWILEGVSQGRYHLAHRWSPDDSTEKRKLEDFLKICRFLISRSPFLEDIEKPVVRGTWKRLDVQVPYRSGWMLGIDSF